MKFFNNRVKSQASIKNKILTKIIPMTIIGLASLTLITYLTINGFVKRDLIFQMNSKQQEAAENINLWLKSRLADVEKITYNTEGSSSSSNKDNDDVVYVDVTVNVDAKLENLERKREKGEIDAFDYET